MAKNPPRIEFDPAGPLGDKLRAARQGRGLTLKDVERTSEGYWRAGTIRAYESGERMPPADKLIELAEFYQVRPSDLLDARAVPASPAAPSPDDQLTIAHFAELLGVEEGTVRAYLARGQVPKPDGYLSDVPWWYRRTVETYIATKPGRGRHRPDCTCRYCTTRREREAAAATTKAGPAVGPRRRSRPKDVAS